jgi:hypothetical protein
MQGAECGGSREVLDAGCSNGVAGGQMTSPYMPESRIILRSIALCTQIPADKTLSGYVRTLIMVTTWVVSCPTPPSGLASFQSWLCSNG